MANNITLSQRQEEIASLKEGAILVRASAGSGKTRVLIERITRLAQSTRRKILAITFTNQACDEIKNRLKMVDEELLEKVFVSTFHGFCASIVESQISSLGLLEMPQVFSEEDRRKILELAINDLPELKSSYGKLSEKERYSRILNFMNSVSVAKRNLLETTTELQRYFSLADYSLFLRYQSHMSDLHAYDYDDLLLNAYHLLSSNPFIAGLYRRSFEYICVDEAQDMNKAQYYVLRALTGNEHKNVMLVGDPNQSIYAFTGASARYMTEAFVKDYTPRTYDLKENYRSARAILNYASQILEQGDVDEVIPLQGKVEEYVAKSVCDEADWIAAQVKMLINASSLPDIEEKLKYQDITIIARNSFVLKKIYDKLESELIPVEWGLGGKKIEFSSQLGDVLDKALTVRANPFDYLHLNQLSSIFNISNVSTLKELCEKVEDSYYSVLLRQIIDLKDDGSNIRALLISIQNRLRDGQVNMDLHSESQEFLLADSDVELLLDAWNKYASSTSVRSLIGYRNAIQLGETQNNVKTNKVLVSSVHAMKGKQSKVVFLAGMDDMTFPDYRSIRDGGIALEQERNNLYVAVTRAQRYLYISYPQSRIMPWNDICKRQRSRLLPSI